ncbi:TRAP transporter small permease [Acuticoccus mangrovi]|uniref:TRAP transporter small permease protein n=1 Tax=Acuticoccus mangrovi TaxID=2796142 RepID=A0A934IPT1_9HYPH|nr:TRAP transporter small permease [Acuticoccus mangrovi]MBJ3776451.1 TRAP transporter small permease [Acuticoccus mangrovi]
MRPATLASALLTAIAGALLMAMMLLTVVDVIGRYVFSAPVPGAFEATEIMLALVVFAGLPLVTGRGEHVQVRLALDGMPGGMRFVLERAAEVLVTLLLAGAAWLLYQRGAALSRYGDATVLLGIPLAPVAFALAALSAVSSIVAVARLVQGCRGALSPTPEIPHDDI